MEGELLNDGQLIKKWQLVLSRTTKAEGQYKHKKGVWCKDKRKEDKGDTSKGGREINIMADGKRGEKKKTFIRFWKM